MGRIVWLIGAAACALSTAAGAASGGDKTEGSAVETALAQHNVWAAVVALNALVDARLPTKDTGKPDPLLDRLFADYFTAGGGR